MSQEHDNSNNIDNSDDLEFDDLLYDFINNLERYIEVVAMAAFDMTPKEARKRGICIACKRHVANRDAKAYVMAAFCDSCGAEFAPESISSIINSNNNNGNSGGEA